MARANLTTAQQGVVWVLVLAGHWLVIWGLLWVQIPQWLATPATPMVVEWIDVSTQAPNVANHQDYNQPKTTAHNKAGNPTPVAQKPTPQKTPSKPIPNTPTPNQQSKASPKPVKPTQSKAQTASTLTKTTHESRPLDNTAPLSIDTKTAPTQNPKPSKQQTTNHNSPADNEPKDNSPMPENNTNAPSILQLSKQDNDKTPSTNAKPSNNEDKDNSQTSTANNNQGKADKQINLATNQHSNKPQGQGANTDQSTQSNAQNTSQEPPSTKGLEQNWASKVRAKLEKSLDYPQEALDKKWGGVAVLSISVDNNGVVLAVSIVKSSGKAVLDEEAIATAKKASPLPKPPNELMNGQTSKSFRIPMRFDFKKY